MSEQKAVHLFIGGRVQGVFYRASAEAEARTRGCKGWIRNLMDGRVEAFVQGAPSAVDAVVQWCRRGPSSARVEIVEASVRNADPSLTEFKVRY